MAAAWMELVTSGEEVRHQLGESARQRVIEDFSLAKTVIAYEELYDSLLGADAV
jgi:glycosyltransferase involved in cell wall biosynthesis